MMRIENEAGLYSLQDTQVGFADLGNFESQGKLEYVLAKVPAAV